MVLDNVSTDPFEDLPTLRNYMKLTWSVLFVQLIVSGFYQYARIHWSGIKYGSTQEDNYTEYPSDVGISFPWVGGIWFVLAVWTTTLPQKPKICIMYTLISILINILADGVNCLYYLGLTTGTLVGFSFLLVFPCLTLMRLAFNKLEIDTKEKQLLNLRTIPLNKIQFIFVIGLVQLYISLPTYHHELTRNYIFAADSYTLVRNVIPTVAGGILNIIYVVSILFMDITKVRLVDFIKGNVYNSEGLVGFFQFLGLALALALIRFEHFTNGYLASTNEVETDPYGIHEAGYKPQLYLIHSMYLSTIGCIGLIWILMTFLAAHVKNDGVDMKYFEQRWTERENNTNRSNPGNGNTNIDLQQQETDATNEDNENLNNDIENNTIDIKEGNSINNNQLKEQPIHQRVQVHNKIQKDYLAIRQYNNQLIQDNEKLQQNNMKLNKTITDQKEKFNIEMENIYKILKNNNINI